MSKVTYTGSIALTKLKHAKFITKQGTKCLLLPINDNLFEVDDKDNMYLPLRILVHESMDDHGQSGLICKSIPSKIYKESSEEQKKAWQEKEVSKLITPILGNIKDVTTFGNNDNSGSVSEVIIENEDDLPF